MTTPYVLPQMLRNSPMGIDWTSVGDVQTTPLDNLAALIDVCSVASGDVDRFCVQMLRATTDTESLEGPTYRLTVANQTGVGQGITSHWPVIAVLGGRVTPSAAYPRTWTNIAANMFSISASLHAPTEGSMVGDSGGDGMNQFRVAPGYVTWATGRNGVTLEVVYQNGWPHAGILPALSTTLSTTGGQTQISVGSTSGLSVGLPVSDLLGAIPYGTVIESLTGTTAVLSAPCSSKTTGNTLFAGYPAGTTTLNVDDVTAFKNTQPRIFDGPWNEQVTVASMAATTPLKLLDTSITVTAGPGTVTLSTPTRFPHVAGAPAQSLISTIPDAVRLAAYYFSAAEALTRGATAITAQGVPGSVRQTPGPTLSPAGLTAAGEARLRNFQRVM
jgi:hypothetical protein